jgi:hypothetical protein
VGENFYRKGGTAESQHWRKRLILTKLKKKKKRPGTVPPSTERQEGNLTW